MKISKHKLTTLFTAGIALVMIASFGHAANLSDQDEKFLTSYEKIHVALAADDLASAKAAATELGDSGSDIAKANSLKDARVQTSTTISNPYGGKDMVSCGEIKK